MRLFEQKRQIGQNSLIFLCWLIYNSAYFGRYSYNANINLVMDSYGVDHADAGLVVTFFFFAYGVGQVLHGFFAKKYNHRVVLAFALILSGVINLIYFIGVPFGTIKYLWLINGILQSMLWPCIIQILSRRLDEKHLNRAILAMSTTTAFGTLITYGLSAVFAEIGHYKYAFIVGTLVPAAAGIVWFAFCPGGKVKPIPNAGSGANPASPRRGISGAVLAIVISLGLFAVTDNFIKDGIQTWVPSILKETYKLSDSISIILTLVLPILGVFGALFAVYLQKYIRNFVYLGTVLLVCSAFFVGVILLTLEKSMWAVLISFGMIILLMHAANNVITSMAPLHLRDKADSGKLAGILNGCCYVGSTLSSYGLGAVADGFGWVSVFLIFLGSAILSLPFCIIYFLISKKQKYKETR